MRYKKTGVSCGSSSRARNLGGSLRYDVRGFSAPAPASGLCTIEAK
jgi:hypothetical protein